MTSLIRVFLTDDDPDNYVDVEEGFGMVVGDEGVLEICDDMDTVLALFRTWDRAITMNPDAPVATLLAPIVDDEDEDEEDDDEDLEDDDEVIDGEVEEAKV